MPRGKDYLDSCRNYNSNISCVDIQRMDRSWEHRDNIDRSREHRDNYPSGGNHDRDIGGNIGSNSNSSSSSAANASSSSSSSGSSSVIVTENGIAITESV